MSGLTAKAHLAFRLTRCDWRATRECCGMRLRRTPPPQMRRLVSIRTDAYPATRRREDRLRTQPERGLAGRLTRAPEGRPPRVGVELRIATKPVWRRRRSARPPSQH